jgi:hypothetical protein
MEEIFILYIYDIKRKIKKSRKYCYRRRRMGARARTPKYGIN